MGRTVNMTASTIKPITTSVRNRSRLLDILRLLAVVLMVVNHFGVLIEDRGASLTWLQRLVTDAGSHAPVVFFFCTGVGYGLKGLVSWNARDGVELLVKSLLLVVADQFLRIAAGPNFWGLDFLAFIGISMLVVGAMSYLRHGVLVAVVLMAIAVVARYGVPLPQGACEPGTCNGLIWALGKRSIAGISYPLSPWIVYPLLGFVVGRWMRDPAMLGLSATRLRWGLAVAAAGWVAMMAMVLLRDLMIFRWSSVTFGFFWLSLGVLAAVYATAWLLDRWGHMPAIEGLPSLMAVPVHYALLKLHTSWVAADSNFWLWMSVAVVSTLAVSVVWSRWLERLVGAARMGTYAWGALALAAMSLMMLGVFERATSLAPVLTLLGVSLVGMALAARPKVKLTPQTHTSATSTRSA